MKKNHANDKKNIRISKVTSDWLSGTLMVISNWLNIEFWKKIQGFMTLHVLQIIFRICCQYNMIICYYFYSYPWCTACTVGLLTLPCLSCCHWAFPQESPGQPRPRPGRSCRHRAAAHRQARPALNAVTPSLWHCAHFIYLTTARWTGSRFV